MTKDEMSELRAMMEEVVSPIKNDISDVKRRVTKLEFTVEHKIDDAIKATMDGHKDLTRKMDAALDVGNRVEILEHKMSAVEYYIKNQQ